MYEVIINNLTKYDKYGNGIDIFKIGDKIDVELKNDKAYFEDGSYVVYKNKRGTIALKKVKTKK